LKNGKDPDAYLMDAFDDELESSEDNTE